MKAGIVGWFAGARTRVAAMAMASALVALAACTTSGGGISSISAGLPFANDPPVPSSTIGSGSIKIGLLLPLSADGAVGQLGANLKNAADLAMRDFPNSNLQLLVEDDGGTPQGARAGAGQAIAAGAQLIIGPLFADSVPAAAGAARNVPVVAFSTDTTKVSRGVYLLSFLPQNDVNRIVAYAASKGKRTFAAMIPNSASGALYEQAFQRAVAANGGQVVGVLHYDADQMSMQQAATALAMQINSTRIDAVFMPDSGDAAPFLAQIVAANGIKPGKVTYLGSGQWNDARVTKESNLNGSWYPGPDNTNFAAFAQRYKAAFGAQPLRNATLAYDAVSLAAGLSTKYGGAAFNSDVLTDPNGFIGVDGSFRLNADGTSQRGLAVYEINLGKTMVVDPAPRAFARPGT